VKRCAEKANAKKYDGAQQCLDIEDLVPRHKLRLPLAGPEAHRPPSPHAPRALADSLLWVAALNGRLAAVQTLLATPGVRVDATNRAGATALHGACERGHAAVVTALLQAGANVEREDGANRRPLAGAAAGGHRAVAEALLAAGADKKGKSFRRRLTAKFLARELGHTHLLDIL
jgi:ankyrin repeat protein